MSSALNVPVLDYGMVLLAVVAVLSCPYLASQTWNMCSIEVDCVGDG